MYVKDLNGDEYMCLATSTKTKALNGEDNLSATIRSCNANDGFINDIEKRWIIADHNDTEYRIVHLNKKTEGEAPIVEVTGRLLFFDVLKSAEPYYGHLSGIKTISNYFTTVFAGLSFQFQIVGSFDSVEWERYGAGLSKTELFTEGINRYKAEFEVIGNTVYIKKKIGSDVDFMLRRKFNASNINQEVDANNMITCVRGYADYDSSSMGDYEAWEDAHIILDYKSPLVAIYGEIWGTPYYNGEITSESKLTTQLKSIVDESVKMSISADTHDLEEYPAEINLGDRIFVIDDDINLKEELRAVELSVTRNFRGKIIDIQATFGEKSLSKRYQANLNQTITDVRDIISGKKPVPALLPEAVKEATQILKSVMTELTVPPNGGWLAIDKNNPNNWVLFNAAGIGISDDGGQSYRTAMTGKGIVADVINVGTLRSIEIDSVTITSSEMETVTMTASEIYGTYIEGSTLVSKISDNNYIKIEGSEFVSRGRHLRDWFDQSGYNDIRVMVQNGQIRMRNDTKNWSLYINDMGLSTFRDGSGEVADMDASGYLEFHSNRYHESNGLTIGSGARLGLETTGGRIYINPNGASVRISDVDDNFYDIAAASFNQSSRTHLKRDIKDLEDDALALINSLQIKGYKRLTKGEETILDRWQAGILVEESPIQLLHDGESIDLYTYVNYVAKAIQQFYAEFKEVQHAAA